MSSQFPSTFSIAGRRVGPSESVFVIAEAGVNHDGDPELGHRLIDLAADAGADAVKFQTFDPVALVSASAGTAPYQAVGGATSQLDMLRQLALPTTAWPPLVSHATERGLVFLSTAFDVRSLDLLLSLEVAALKVPSGELDNLDFISTLAKCEKPLLLSTGLGTLDEVERAVWSASAAPALALLHCVTAYPAPAEQSNLRALTTMSRSFGLPVGWSDHTEGVTSAVAAVALGACVLEKHLTSDTDRAGPDHAASADPTQFAAYVRAVRAAESALGDGIKRPSPVEAPNRYFVRRSYHAARFLPAGHRLQAGDLELLRPAAGLPAGASYIGRTVGRSVRSGEPVRDGDLRD